MSQSLRDARSLLFVPGDRPERFAKAEAAGADLVCIDLEDAVPPAARADARLAVLAHLRAATTGHRTGVRVNALTSADGLRDLLALADGAVRPAFVMLAKTEDAGQLRLVAAQLPGTPLIALIESPGAMASARAMAGADAQVQALMLGGADYCATLGAEFAWEPLLQARGALVAAAAEAGIASIDVPFIDLADDAGLVAETRRVAALGIGAKACIHPRQVGPVHDALRPEAAAIAQAQRIVQAVRQSGAGALHVDGRFVDRPVVLAAERTLRRAAT